MVQKGFFTELNRNRPPSPGFDFLSYSVNPQVHASDIRSLVENLEGQKYTIETARSFAPEKEIHISPVTLKRRNDPESDSEKASKEKNNLPRSIDARQPSNFVAAWTLLTLKYLAGADAITFYETVGMKGLMMGEAAPKLKDVFPAGDDDIFPFYQLLKRIKDFNPQFILETHYPDPLIIDGTAFENASGEQLWLEVDFMEGKIHEKRENLDKWFSMIRLRDCNSNSRNFWIFGLIPLIF